VIGKPAQMIFQSPAKQARLLAALLLASLAWGTTAEFNHHHGNRARFDQSLLSTTQAQEADDASSVKVESTKTNGTTSSSKTGAACLICQLHQNLSATALGHTPGVGTTETHGLKAPPSVVLQLSEFTANCQGRAPPSNL
jgi:hypothetical protein